jgi:hypothetical protein
MESTAGMNVCLRVLRKENKSRYESLGPRSQGAGRRQRFFK